MEDIADTTSQRTTTTTTTTRRLRSLHLPSSGSTTHEISRRFTSLRRPNTTTNTSPLATTPVNEPIPSPSPVVGEAATSSSGQKVHIKLVPNVGMTNRCFVFDVVDRELEMGSGLKLGRYSDRTIVSDRLSFKSKVVSRYHAEIWLSEEDGKIYIKDSGSSSGTFVNHIRLTAANTESARPHPVVDGDLIQLGVDYKGGLEPMYRAVRMRLEVNRREWQESCSNTYSLAAFQQLKHQINNTSTGNTNNNNSREEIQECCICLYCIAPFQALFIAPCSHIYHYRCLRPLLTQNYPGFSCPLCRTYSNLEASVAVEENEVLQMLGLSTTEPSPSTNNNNNNNNNTTSEEEEEEEEDNSPLIASHTNGGHHREKTVLDEEALQQEVNEATDF
ncbi:uncharacterized protein EV154DRAFT_431616 [Mucor mucedo]|uniref:uncharacterized protein n=1 Tax=Mucor mucedo TaxID=29922 RepID=UPI0022210FB3|nr:uncharacterized protein EV154DRAFT_431616 [Mucor mucedo]KAI7871376.1 hypothetical protein EV154DRAFT_431616 [Mucor mucedo]